MDENESEVCYWVEDLYYDAFDTSCGNKFQFTAGGVQGNHFMFCPYCGKLIVEPSPPVRKDYRWGRSH